MKWKSKATGIVYSVVDGFYQDKHYLGLFMKDKDSDTSSPYARLSYQELLEAFEKMEE